MMEASARKYAEAQDGTGFDPATRDGAGGRAAHHRIYVSVEPHVDRAGRTGGDRDAQHGGERQHRVDVDRGDDQTDRAGEYDEADDAGLEKDQPVAEFARAQLGLKYCRALARQ